MSKEIKFICNVCGSQNIQWKGWVWANTREFTEEFEEDDDSDTWCTKCNEHTGYEQKTLKKMKGLVLFYPPKDNVFTAGTIVLEDGGVACFHHNGEMMIESCYQSRATEFPDGDLWEQLGNGKMYVREWPEEQAINHNMITGAVTWLTADSKILKDLLFEMTTPETEQHRIRTYLKAINT